MSNSSLEEQIAALSPEARELYEETLSMISNNPIATLNFARFAYMNYGKSPESTQDLWSVAGLYLTALAKIILEQQKQIDKLSELVHRVKRA